MKQIFITLTLLLMAATEAWADDTPSSHGAEKWYTLDGRPLNGKPTARGIYVRSTSGRLQGKNNGRKMLITIK